jgi:hypothetical protein
VFQPVNQRGAQRLQRLNSSSCVLFVAFALVALFSVLPQLVTSGANVVYLFSLVFARGPGRGKAFSEYAFLSAANVVQLAEMGFVVLFTAIIYSTSYP